MIHSWRISTLVIFFMVSIRRWPTLKVRLTYCYLSKDSSSIIFKYNPLEMLLSALPPPSLPAAVISVVVGGASTRLVVNLYQWRKDVNTVYSEVHVSLFDISTVRVSRSHCRGKNLSVLDLFRFGKRFLFQARILKMQPKNSETVRWKLVHT